VCCLRRGLRRQALRTTERCPQAIATAQPHRAPGAAGAPTPAGTEPIAPPGQQVPAAPPALRRRTTPDAQPPWSHPIYNRTVPNIAIQPIQLLRGMTLRCLSHEVTKRAAQRCRRPGSNSDLENRYGTSHWPPLVASATVSDSGSTETDLGFSSGSDAAARLRPVAGQPCCAGCGLGPPWGGAGRRPSSLYRSVADRARNNPAAV
jgi:hypothetical protein